MLGLRDTRRVTWRRHYASGRAPGWQAGQMLRGIKQRAERLAANRTEQADV
jgi:hypothetical protein